MTIKINQKIIKAITIIITFFVLAATGVFIFSNHGTSIVRDKSRIGEKVNAKGLQVSDTMSVVAQSEKQTLFFNGTDCTFAVEDKTTKTRWYSNPPISDVLKLELNQNTNKVINSQLVIHYTNSIQQEIVMDSQTFSIDLKQYTAKKIDGGVLVTYSFAYPDSDEIFPRALSIERYDEIVKGLKFTAEKSLMKKMYSLIDRNSLKDTELTKLKERYGALNEKNIYILREGQLNTANKKSLTKLFTSIGYTKKQLKLDLEEVMFKGSNGSGESYTIPVSYVLEEDGLRVSIDSKNIHYTETDSGFFPLTGIDLLTYFGCTTQNEDGFLFVPDGSGSQIDFAKRNNRNTTLEGYVYGRDLAILSETNSDFTENFTMPVFGIKDAKGAILAVIEDGDAMARIKVNTGGDGIPYNRIGVSFDTMIKDYIPIGENATRENFNVYTNEIYDGTFAVKYYFIPGKNIGISKMAEVYRANLLSRNKLTKRLQDKLPTTIMELQGAIDVTKTLAGIPYKTTTALTDFSDVRKVVETLASSGIENPVINYTGIYKGGYKTTIQKTFRTDNSLGNKNDLDILTSYLNSKEIKIYSGANFYQINKESLFEPFNKKVDAVRNLTKEISSIDNNYLLSPVRFTDVVNSYAKGSEDSKIYGVAPFDMGRSLYSDFSPGRYISRQKSLSLIQKSLSGLETQNMKIMSDGANAYMLEFADIMTDVPYEDSSFIISSRSVPFYQMVIHGYTDYCSKPINYDSEPELAVLKSVMSGSLLSFKLIGKSPEILNDTDYADLYASGFDDWKEKIILWNKKTNQFYNSVREQKIIEFTYLSDNVTLTVFEKNEVVVNLSGAAYSYKGVVISPKDFHLY